MLATHSPHAIMRSPTRSYARFSSSDTRFFAPSYAIRTVEIAIKPLGEYILPSVSTSPSFSPSFTDFLVGKWRFWVRLHRRVLTEAQKYTPNLKFGALHDDSLARAPAHWQ